MYLMLCVFFVTCSFVNCQNSYNATVAIQNICLNIYDNFDFDKSQHSQVVIQYFAMYGHSQTPIANFTSKSYTLGDNGGNPIYVFTIDQNLILHLKTDDVVSLLFSIKSLGNSAGWIKCPFANGLFSKVINPSEILSSVGASSYETTIRVDLTLLSSCDGTSHTNNCDESDKSPGITIDIKFTCPESCSNLFKPPTIISPTMSPASTTKTSISSWTATTTTSVPVSSTQATQYIEPTTSFASRGSTASSASPPVPSHLPPVVIGLSVVTGLQLIVIGTGIVLYMRLWRSRNNSHNPKKPSSEGSNDKGLPVAFSHITAPVAPLNAGGLKHQSDSSAVNPAYGHYKPTEDMNNATANNDLYS